MRRYVYTKWSDTFKVDPHYIKEAGGVTRFKEYLKYKFRKYGYQIRFLKAGRGRIRYQVRKRLL